LVARITPSKGLLGLRVTLTWYCVSGRLLPTSSFPTGPTITSDRPEMSQNLSLTSSVAYHINSCGPDGHEDNPSPSQGLCILSEPPKSHRVPMDWWMQMDVNGHPSTSIHSDPNRPASRLRSLAWLDTAGLNGLAIYLLD
jgi:hypothetical protein